MSRRSLFAGVFLLFLGVYLLLGGSGFYSTDGETMLRTTWAIVDRGRLSVPCDSGQPSAVPGRDERCYSRYGLGQPIAAVPLYLFGKAVASVPGVDYGDAIRFVVSKLNAWVVALCCGLVALIAAQLGGAGAGLPIALVFGLGTLALPYSRFYFNEPLTALCLLMATWAILGLQTGSMRRCALFAGLAFGFAVLTRSTVAVLFPPFLAYLALKVPDRSRRLGASLAFTLPALALGAVQMGYHAWAFGGLLSGGYAGEGWQTPLVQGLSGLLLSPGKSILLFTPLVVLFPWGLAVLARQGRRAEAILFVAVTLIWLLVHAGWWTWHGGWSWGPRFLMPLTPFWALALSPLWRRGGTGRAAILALGALGFAVNAGGVLVNFGDYMMAVNDEDKVLFDAAFSPVWGHWRMLLAGAPADLAVLHMPALPGAIAAALSGAFIGAGGRILLRPMRPAAEGPVPAAPRLPRGQASR